MYYELMYANGVWAAYDAYNPAEDWLCWDTDREACIGKAEKLGYIWAGI